eukprot:g6260.t1
MSSSSAIVTPGRGRTQWLFCQRRSISISTAGAAPTAKRRGESSVSSLPHYVFRGVQRKGGACVVQESLSNRSTSSRSAIGTAKNNNNSNSCFYSGATHLSGAAEAALSPKNTHETLHRVRKAIAESLLFLMRPDEESEKWTAYAIKALGRFGTKVDQAAQPNVQSILALLDLHLDKDSAVSPFYCFSASLAALPAADATSLFDSRLRAKLPTPEALDGHDDVVDGAQGKGSSTNIRQKMRAGVLVTYSALMQRCVRDEHPRVALQYFHELRTRYPTLRLNSQLLTTAVKALDAVGDAAGALRLLHRTSAADAEYAKASDQERLVDLVLLNAVLSVLVRHPGFEKEAVELFKKLDKPSTVSVNTMLRLFSRQKDASAALKTLRDKSREDEQLRTSFDQVTLSTLLQCFTAAEWKRAAWIALQPTWEQALGLGGVVDAERDDHEEEHADQVQERRMKHLLFMGKRTDVGHKGGNTLAWGFTHLFSLLCDALALSRAKTRGRGPLRTES